MENASKALLMAAGVLIALIVIGALLLLMGNLTTYQQSADALTESEQITEFNNQYAYYDRDNVRGNEIISLTNKIIDYNSRKNQDGYTEMGIEINMVSESNRKNLLYNKDESNKVITKNIYFEDDISEIRGNINDSTSRSIAWIENYYGEKYANNFANEISNIESFANNPNSDIRTYVVNEGWVPNGVIITTTNGLRQFFEDAKKYYEYVQFKRAIFKCTEVEYDRNTSRIINMKFEYTGMGV